MTDLKRLQKDNAKLRAAKEKLRTAVLDVLQHSYMPIQKVWKILAKAERATR